MGKNADLVVLPSLPYVFLCGYSRWITFLMRIRCFNPFETSIFVQNFFVIPIHSWIMSVLYVLIEWKLVFNFLVWRSILSLAIVCYDEPLYCTCFFNNLRCTFCNTITRFPRYNDPLKVLIFFGLNRLIWYFMI